MIPCGGGGQFDFRAGVQGQCREDRSIVSDCHCIRLGNGIHGGTAVGSVSGGSDCDFTALCRCGQHAIAQRAGGSTETGTVGHGNIIGIHRRGGNIHLAACQYMGGLRLHIEMGQAAAGIVIRHQENLIGHRALTAGGGIDHFSLQRIRLGDRKGCGTAAIKANCRRTAQLYEPLPHLRQGRTDGMSAAAAVDGIEDQCTIRALANRSTGIDTGF